jgi:hypothetical protein
VTGGLVGQTASSPAQAVQKPTGYNFAAEIVEEEAKTLKAPGGFAGTKWLMNADKVRAIRPKARSENDGGLFEAMEWLGRSASVSYSFEKGLFVIAIATLSDATAADFEKTQKYLQGRVWKHAGAG